jgi:hypothetical protein
MFKVQQRTPAGGIPYILEKMVKVAKMVKVVKVVKVAMYPIGHLSRTVVGLTRSQTGLMRPMIPTETPGTARR